MTERWPFESMAVFAIDRALKAGRKPIEIIEQLRSMGLVIVPIELVADALAKIHRMKNELERRQDAWPKSPD